MEILPLGLGLLASAIVVLLSFAKRQRTIALISAVMSAVLVCQYLTLGQPVAVALSAMSLGYGVLIFATVESKGRFSQAANSTAVRAGLLIGYTGIFMALNGGIGLNLQLFAYLGSMLMVAVMMVSNIWLTKLILLIAGICWTIFQFNTGAYGNLLGQLFYFSGLIWSSWKLWSNRTEGAMGIQPDARLQLA